MTNSRGCRLTLLIALTVDLARPAPPPATPRRSARALLRTAEAAAKAAHRNVLVIFDASWCIWCRTLDDFVGATPTFGDAFTILRLDVDEDAAHLSQQTPGGELLMRRLGGPASLPFLAILRPSGKPVIISDRTPSPRSIIGYPVKPDEVAWFERMIRLGAPTLSQSERDGIARGLVAFNRQRGLH